MAETKGALPALVGFLMLVLAGLALAAPAQAAKAPTGGFQMLHDFCPLDNCPDGAYPESSIIPAANGSVISVTCAGGSDNAGVAFAVTRNGTEKVLANFAYESGGCPTGVKLLAAGSDRFFGMSGEGGAYSCGSVFELSKSAAGTWKLTDLYDFGAYDGDGCGPAGGVVMDRKGDLYGFTSFGGTNFGANCYEGGTYGCGIAFELSPPQKKGQPWVETVLYAFCALDGCADGGTPISNPAIDAGGTVYGTTMTGGTANAGTLFALPPYGGEAVLHSFCQAEGCTDGTLPLSVAIDAKGTLYGTTLFGGAGYYAGSNGFGVTGGTVYQYAKNGLFSVLHSFCQDADCTDGYAPASGLALDQNGNLYGATSSGGNTGCDEGCGVVFELFRTGGAATLHAFDGTDGYEPLGSGITMDAKGNLYGATYRGGNADRGTVFVLRP